jgi:hypothetical protein
LKNRLIEQELNTSQFIRPCLNGKDLTNKPRGVHVIDLFGRSETDAREHTPMIYQHLLTTVKPLRDQNSRESYKRNWWILGEPQPALRKQVDGLPRFIVTPVTAKHRFFLLIESVTLPDQALNVIASGDAFHLGILSSSIHVCWALAAGGRLGVGNDPRYNNTRCFLTFPFPALEESPLKQRIRDLGERLDAHRKARQAAHPELTLTGIYNVLEKLRAEEPLADKDKKIHDLGLVTILKQIHDDLDAAVFEAYGWSDLHCSVNPEGAIATPENGEAQSGWPIGNLRPSLANEEAPSLVPNGIDGHRPTLQSLDQELLSRLVALNHERAAEEKRGLVRWLRPEYQSPHSTPQPEQTQINLGDTSSSLPHQQSKINNPQSTIHPPQPPGQPPSPPKSPPSKSSSPTPAPTPPPSPPTSANAPNPASNKSPKSSKPSELSGNCECTGGGESSVT